MAEIDGYLDLIRNATDGETVRDAIINCMNFINQDGYVKRVPKEIVHEMGEDESWDHTVKAASGEAFSQVHLLITRGSGSVENKEKAVNFLVTNETANDTYYPKDYDGDYFDEVKVEIDWTSMMDDDIQDNIVISRDDLYNDERYPEGGTFSAEDLGYSAMRSITFVDVKGTGGGIIGPGGVRYFKVTFYNYDGTILDTVTVQSGCDAELQLSEEKKKALYSKIPKGSEFMGWDPSVKKVTKDLPKVNPIVNKSYIPVGEEITDTWDEIAECKGSKYNLGQWKMLDMRFPEDVESTKTIYPYRDVSGIGLEIKPHAANLKMVLVAHGYGGTTSTWVAANFEPSFRTPDEHTYDGVIYNADGSLYKNSETSSADHNMDPNGHIDWSESMLRHLLNNVPYVFIDNMTYPKLIDGLASTSRYVPVLSKAPGGNYWQNKLCHDKIFVCTMGELFGNRGTMDNRAAQYELVGNDVFPVGTHPEGVTRNFVWPWENFGQNIYNKSFYSALEKSNILENGGPVSIGGMGETNSLREAIDTQTRPEAPTEPRYSEEANMRWINSEVCIKNGVIVPYEAWTYYNASPSVQFLGFSL